MMPRVCVRICLVEVFFFHTIIVSMFYIEIQVSAVGLDIRCHNAHLIWDEHSITISIHHSQPTMHLLRLPCNTSSQ